MLKLFRQKNVAKMVLWGLLILILPAFVLWGTGSLSGSKNKGPKFIGLIDGKKVSFDEFGTALASMRCQILLNYFNQQQMLDAFFKNRAFLAKLAWDRIIMTREMKKYKIKIPDKELIAFIRSHPLFLRNGVFDDKIYGYILRYNLGLEPRDFEEIMRENLAIQKMHLMLTNDIKVSDEEVLEAYRKANDKFRIAYLLFPTDNFKDRVGVGEDEIKDYYEKHKGEFLLPPAPVKEGGEQKPEEPKMASLDDVKDAIKSVLAEVKARPLAVKYAEDEYVKITGIMNKDKKTFEAAASTLGLKIQETDLFSKKDYLEGIGDTGSIIDAAVKLKNNELSHPVETRKGALIFTVTDIQKFDEEKFKKEKDDFSKSILEYKKNSFLDKWLRTLETRTTLNINFNELDKYYR